MQLTKNIFLSFVIAGRSKYTQFERWELESKHRPRFGRNWWFWTPRINSNGGRFKPHRTTDVGIQWLCFSLSLMIFAWKKIPKNREILD